MSDNTPITGELRELLADISWTEIIDHMRMNSGATVDGGWLDSWRAAADRACDAIDAIYANLERENESLRRELDHDGWVELPKDADGEVIHAGDELCGYGWQDGGVYCKAIVNERTILVGTADQKYSDWLMWDTEDTRHYHAPTVEDVLREMLDAWGELPSNATNEAIIAEYAAKLRLAGE